MEDSQYRQAGQANGYGQADATKQRFMGPPLAPVDTRSPNGSSNHSPVDGRHSRSKDLTQDLPVRERSRTNGASGGKSHTVRLCHKCGEPLTGQFVRALGGTFHLECFKCRDCGQVVASKFFPVDDEEGEGQYPLCETDYFRRLDLLCFDCGGALRGSYITALERKYHIEHFTCSVCPTVFGAQDSYYEHEGKVYCHYHYSTQFAQRCNGCRTAILKQFVEIFRNGQNQHWHPECYMIHKFWNVRLAPSDADGNYQVLSETNATEEKRTLVREEEEQMEEKVYRIWSVLSAFEESSAACISDMLLHVSNGSYVEGIVTARKFIWHVDILFRATDKLDFLMVSEGIKGLSYGREAKLLCKKIVAFFSLLSKTQETGVKKLGVTQELLSLVTGLAHYLKLLIRISLQGALKLEREQRSNEGLHHFLADLENLNSIKKAETSDLHSGVAGLSNQQSDICHKCKEPIDDECVKLDQQRWHKNHLVCDYCERVVGHPDLSDALWSEREGQIVCRRCFEERREASDAIACFEPVTRLQQYVYLLRVALARLLSVLRSGGTLPHTSDDPNLTTYDSNEGHRLNESGQIDPPLLRADSRSKSYGGTGTSAAESNQSSYQQTVGEMKRLRSTRMDTQLSTNIKKARTSRILDGPEGRRPGSAGADGSDQKQHSFHIVEDRDPNNDVPSSNLTFGHQDALTLDDIPRIVAAEQAKEQRPNAYKHAKHQLIGNGGHQPKFYSGHQRGVSGGNDLDIPGGDSGAQRTKRYFSELSALEYFIVRHVAVLSMEPLLEGHYNLEDLLNLIETRKPTFWGKFGKAFQKNDRPRGGKKKGVFGIPLDVLVERDGVESTYGVGPGALRVPGIVDDTISAMRQMDMSVEGVFRKNGNIRGLKDLSEKLDQKEVEVDLSKENPVQVAALLKKFLRELPDPLLTYKLYRLFVTSQKIEDEAKRKRVLHLTCCLLPKSHRDTLEILFSFLVWASSFSQVDEESGSKMDTHNLATVITPNILKDKTAVVGQDENSFLAIEVINTLIEFNDEMSEVPEDLQSILNDSSLFNNSSDITTKEILKRYGDIGRSPAHRPIITEQAAESPPSRSKDNNTPNNAKPAAPVITHVDTDPYQTPAWPKESSVRHVQGQAQGAPTYPSTSNNTPPQQQFEFNNPTSPYHRRGGSSDSQASNRSGGHGHSHKYSGWGKQGTPGPMGVTGAG
ncbi:hypothetical protein HO133_003384 [Letharia lupina]|uniref:Uncharacterized protein n=1 Tax=Letharia lupina TaxID=560253 RepID=A0A8H6F9H7_9LECA|nr:uncharacterized protein HO133_003384 [Letharia lupina]KAF6220252.1 hypothetical protein HO133_003384 [Letharia lupina]